MLNENRLAEIAALRKSTNKVEKAQAFDRVVDELLGEVRRLDNDNRRLNADADRLKVLERLELALASVGYCRAPTAS